MITSTKCVICGEALASQREKDLGICFLCRRYGLLNGVWPKENTPSLPVNCVLPQLELERAFFR
jgi:hypothetical protein